MLHLFSLLPLLTPSLSTLHPPFLDPGLTYDIFPPAAPQVSLLPLPASLPTIHCTPWPNWTASYREKDCYKALDIFYERDVKRHGRTLHEWVTIGDRPVGRDVPVWVPKGVVVGAYLDFNLPACAGLGLWERGERRYLGLLFGHHLYFVGLFASFLDGVLGQMITLLIFCPFPTLYHSNTPTPPQQKAAPSQ